MPGELLQSAILPLVSMGDVGHFGQYPVNWLEAGAAAAVPIAGTIGLIALRGKMNHGGGSHDKPAEIREARARFVKPWESGLLLKNGSFFDADPILDEEGKPVVQGGQEQFTKEFHQVIKPGFSGAANLVCFWRKMIIVNNMPDEASFPMTHIKDAQGQTVNLTGGITWAHARAQDEYKRPMVYHYLEPSYDGRRPAGPISAGEALLRAISTAPTRAEAARQLTLIAMPEVVKRLHGDSNPLETATEPEFFVEVERAVHDRFLDRGSVLMQVGVAPNVNPETESAKIIAASINKRTRLLKQVSKKRLHSVNGLADEYGNEEVASTTSLKSA